MEKRFSARLSTLTWGVVVLVGILVLLIVFGLRLFPRLGGGQELLDYAAPAFTEQRIEGSRAGITMVSSIVDLADPLATANGGASAEVPKLIAFVSKQSGLPPADVLAALQGGAPKTTALLQSLPLSAVSAELPQLIAFLAKTLDLTQPELEAALAKSFPRLAQAIAALPKVTGGWEAVPGTTDLTRFDGSPVRTVPDVRDYFSADVIPVLERQGGNFRTLDSDLRVSALPPLAAAIGLLALLFGLGQIALGRMGVSRGWEHSIAWVVVAVVGVLVITLVATARLFPRLDGGQKLLDDAAPAFTEERVAGARAGIGIVSAIVDLADPIVLTQDGAAAEVPKLVGLVAQKTGLSDAEVVATLQKSFPHTTALLLALPLEDVTAEQPALLALLGKTLGLSKAEVLAALTKSFPRLAQSIVALPTVTGGWDTVPGTEDLTRFDGSPVRTVPDVRDFFSADVIPVLERQGGNFRKLESTWPPVNYFPPLLTVIGVVVILYGLLMALFWRPRGPLSQMSTSSASPTEPPAAGGPAPAVPA